MPATRTLPNPFYNTTDQQRADRDALLKSWDQRDMAVGTPYPTRTGTGFQQALQAAMNKLMGSVAGGNMFLRDYTMRPVLKMGDNISDWMGQQAPTQEFPQSAKPTPVAAPQATSTLPAPPGLDVNSIFGKMDGTTVIPGNGGTPMPTPALRNPGYIPPDYSAADQKYAAASPKPLSTPEQWDDRANTAGWEGVGEAAGNINPRSPWGTALAQAISGYTQGVAGVRRQQHDMDLQQQERVDQYNLQMAGVDERRAAMEANAKADAAKAENEVAMQQWQAQMQKWQNGQVQATVNPDGSVVSTERQPDGSLKINRMGFGDAAKLQLMLSQAKQIYGSRGMTAAYQQATNMFGAAGALAVALQDADRLGIVPSLLPDAAQKALDSQLESKSQELLARGFSGTALQQELQKERQAVLFQLFSSNPELQGRLTQAIK